MSEMSVMSVMRLIVPITRFNKGEANRIFDEVESGGTRVVMKNNRPVCVLMSPGKYEALMEMLADYFLQEEADARMVQYNPDETLSQEEVMASLGVSREDLDGVDVEIE